MSDTLKIAIIDDHEIFRNGLKMVLGKLKYTKVVIDASSGIEFLENIKDTEIDIALMDIEMPVMNGVETTKKALELNPNLKIVALTMFNDDEYVQSMIDAGVKGFLIKNISKEILDKALKTISSGNTYYSEELWDFFTRKMVQENEKPKDNDLKLTRRENEILQLLAEGYSNKEIADKLFVTERTVVGHKSNLLSKTGCKSTISLLSYSIKNKLVVI